MAEELRRLLDAEARAEALVDEAKRECDRLIEQAHAQARAAEQRVEEHLPELRSSFFNKAVERTDSALAELERRYQQRGELLRALAREHGDEAVSIAFALFVDPDWE